MRKSKTKYSTEVLEEKLKTHKSLLQLTKANINWAAVRNLIKNMTEHCIPIIEEELAERRKHGDFTNGNQDNYH